MKFISIIIPTFNRSHLLGETLDSILAQTYMHWECIVVDDGSIDASQSLFDNYANNDERFRFLSRPAHKPKGANACRNIGLELAKGDYVVFFDSDDLMTQDHLEVKLNAIVESGCDYVITRTKFFNSDNSRLDKYYTFNQFEITPYNYVAQKVNWLTLDVCIKADLAKSLKFNEELQAGQEFNYFSKLVHNSVNALFINKVVSLRRHHEESIRSTLKTKNARIGSNFFAAWHTFHDIQTVADRKTLKVLVQNFSKFTLEQQHFFGVSKIQFYKILFSFFGISTVIHIIYMISTKLFNRGYIFRTSFTKIIEK